MSSYLPTLFHQYAALHPVKQLSLPSDSPAANLALARDQPWLVAHMLQHSRLAAFPPARDYQRAFWKLLVGRLEDGCALADEAEELEVHEEIYEAYLETIQSSASLSDASPFSTAAPPTASFKTFFFPSPAHACASADAAPPSPPCVHPLAVTLHEEQKTIQAGTTGLRTWGASLRLAELILADPHALLPLAAGGTVLELGSGVGFLGLFVARLAASLGEQSRCSETVKSAPSVRVTMTDFDERVLAALQENVQINGFSNDEVSVAGLNWEDSVPGPEGVPPLKLDAFPVPDLIIAADVVYDPSIIAPLVATLVLFLSTHPPPPLLGAPSTVAAPRAAIIASTVRNQTTFDAFGAEASARGLQAEELSQARAERTFWGADEGGAGNLEVRILKFTMR